MRKLYISLCALSCLLMSCKEDNAAPPTEDSEEQSCPDNTDANYANDQYSAFLNKDESITNSIKANNKCTTAFPFCLKSTNDTAPKNTVFCSRCKSGEIYAQWGEDEESCHSCQVLIQHESECTDENCNEILARCKAASTLPDNPNPDKPNPDNPNPDNPNPDKPNPDNPNPDNPNPDKPNPNNPNPDDKTDGLTAYLTPITLYGDMPRKQRFTYQQDEKPVPGTKLTIVDGKDNKCVEFLTDSLVTDASGYAFLSLKSKGIQNETCATGVDIKVCLEQDKEICTEFKVRSSSEEYDRNGNFMFDDTELNADGDNAKFGTYEPGNCTTFCQDDKDCPTTGFCDSAIGSRCSTRCSSDDQCISLKDNESWIEMKCRADGRCAYPDFKYQYKISKAGAEVTLGGRPVAQNDKCTIDWGDGTIENIPATTDNNLKHKYKTAATYTVTLSGEYEDWRAGCSENRGIDMADVLQFGPVGLGYMGNHDDIDRGTFTNCTKFNKMSAKDIPDASKLTNMSAMFAGYEKLTSGDYASTRFNNPAIGRWDTSNVTEMHSMFFNSGDGDKQIHGFNQDIGRWNVSKVETMSRMFMGAVSFNANIGCWNVSSLQDMERFLFNATSFNQNLDKWNLSSIDNNSCVFRAENGHNGVISLKNYCMLRSRVLASGKTGAANVDIGRDGRKNSCVDYGDKDRTSTCCGISQMGPEMNICNDGRGNGYDYGPTCDAELSDPLSWKSVVYRCKDEYLSKQPALKDLTEDDITCHHLRICRTCYGPCHKCTDKCHADYPNKTDKECDDFCSDKQVLFDEYGVTGGGTTKVWCSCQGMSGKRYWEK